MQERFSDEAKPEAKETHKALELFNLEPEEKEKLKLEVEAHNGIVRIFIHPLALPDKQLKPNDTSRIQSVLARVLRSKKSPPIIIFENEGFIEPWRQLPESRDLPNDLYIVPTLNDYFYPVIPDKEKPTERDENGYLLEKDRTYIEEGIKLIIQNLKDLGVQTILVGGTKLEIINDNLNRCVGNFIRFLNETGTEGMEIKLSMGTGPIHRNSDVIRKDYPDLL